MDGSQEKNLFENLPRAVFWKSRTPNLLRPWTSFIISRIRARMGLATPVFRLRPRMGRRSARVARSSNSTSAGPRARLFAGYHVECLAGAQIKTWMCDICVPKSGEKQITSNERMDANNTHEHIFEGLVLRCIEGDFCKFAFIFQHFSRSGYNIYSL